MGAFLEYIFDLIIFIVAARLLGAGLRRLFGTSSRQPGSAGAAWRFRTTTYGRPPRPNASAEVQGATARDPECGIFVSTELSHKLNENGKVLHFCSEACLEKYRSHA